MWTNGSVRGVTLKTVTQNTVDHRVKVVLTSSRDRALTDNNMIILMSLLPGIYLLVCLVVLSFFFFQAIRKST